jgi:hypothetical protein
MTNSSKRIKTLGLHEWSDNELMVNFYVTKFGLKNIDVVFKTVEELCQHLKVDVVSFKMQSSNFRMLMRCTTNVLTDYSKLQKGIYDLCNGETFYEFYRVVKSILDVDGLVRERMIKKFRYCR